MNANLLIRPIIRGKYHRCQFISKGFSSLTITHALLLTSPVDRLVNTRELISFWLQYDLSPSLSVSYNRCTMRLCGRLSQPLRKPLPQSGAGHRQFRLLLNIEYNYSHTRPDSHHLLRYNHTMLTEATELDSGNHDKILISLQWSVLSRPGCWTAFLTRAAT
jgi:hypothetical protein